MRPSENVKSSAVNVKSSAVIEAPVKVKGFPAIRLPVKKIYCTKCKRLVKGQVKSTVTSAQVNCSRCGQSLWVWNSTTWRSAGNVADTSPKAA